MSGHDTTVYSRAVHVHGWTCTCGESCWLYGTLPAAEGGARHHTATKTAAEDGEALEGLCADVLDSLTDRPATDLTCTITGPDVTS